MTLTLFINPEHRPGDPLAQRFADHAEQVRVARQAGFDGVVIGHHLSHGEAVWFPPLLALARLVPEADGMALGTCMLALPLLNPVHVAEEAAFLDLLSGGRLVLGVAPGWQRAEYRTVGVEFKERIARFVEAVTLIGRLWTEERVDFAGQHFEVARLSLALRPVQRPRPPFWFGGSTAPAIRRAAQLAEPAAGDSWVPSSHLTHEVIAAQTGVFRQALAELGKPFPRAFPVLRNIVVAPDRATAIRDAGPYLEASYRVFGGWGLFTEVAGAAKAQLDLPELLAGRVVIGGPEECAEELLGLARSVGFGRLVCRVQWMGMEQRLVLRTIDLLAERVLPALAREAVATGAGAGEASRA
jgi:alkanesulfonate monooxygenase SsuD/methylene tetrahydromethanopterin reductase-like flavin-dependent oxidoreductase (luciferase family)